jgi:hypothetical protein
MSDRLDREIRSMVVELMESSPAPHPAYSALRSLSLSPPPVTMRLGLGGALAAAGAVLLIGLAGAWIGRSVLPTDLDTDVPIMEGMPAPEPGFEQFGEEVDLLPSSEEVQPEVVPGTLDGKVISVGLIEGTDLEVFTWHTTEPANGTCLQVIGFRAGQTTCESVFGSEPDIHSPFVFPRFDETTGEAIDVVAIWQVPNDTSIVQVGVGDRVLWQRPNSGVVAFTFDADATRVILNAVDTQSGTVGTVFFSPLELANPGAAESVTLQGSPQDLVELEDTHPAVRLLAEGATDHDTFVAAASEQGIEFTCTAVEGFPSYELCLVAHEGVLAIVPFDGLTGLAARISDSNLVQDVVVPLDTTEPLGVLNTRPGTSVEIEYFGDPMGGVSAPWSPSQANN